MICEDKEDILDLYSSFLQRKFNVITALSGEACLSVYREERDRGRKVDILLLDYRLGDMLGDQVACKIKEMDDTKTILITAYEIDDTVLVDLRERECIIAEMKKPVSLPDLEKKIQQLLT
jgi:response regulator RpfG family c-di-GMP phosphodiesterase